MSGKSPSLLASRSFVADMARLAEGLVMMDITESFWEGIDEHATVEHVQAALQCRERAMMPDKVGDELMKPKRKASMCEVRKWRARWALDIHRRYRPSHVTWIDSGVGQEKAVAVMLLQRGTDAPLIVVAWRGSKSRADYLKTDVSIRLAALPAEYSALRGSAPPGRPPPRVTRGLWRAYAGSDARKKET